MLDNFAGRDANDPSPITGREALSDSEQLLATHFRSSPLGFALLDSGLHYLAINDALSRMNGLPAAEHLGKTVREVVGQLADAIEPMLRRVFSTGEPVLDFELSGELLNRAESGCWIEHIIPIKDAFGEVSRVGVIIFERTLEKRLQTTVDEVERQLKDQKNRLQVLHDISSILSSNSNVQEVFPLISGRIRRVLRQEYAGFEVHDVSSGLLVRHAEDFPLNKGHLGTTQIGANNSPGGALPESSQSHSLFAGRVEGLRCRDRAQISSRRLPIVVLYSGAAS